MLYVEGFIKDCNDQSERDGQRCWAQTIRRNIIVKKMCYVRAQSWWSQPAIKGFNLDKKPNTSIFTMIVAQNDL